MAESKSEKGYRVDVFKTDRRTKSGERHHGSYEYRGWSKASVEHEIRDLSHRLYPASQGWRFEVTPLTRTVKNMMSGQDVEIDSRDAGTHLDPSQERYWSM